jgi:regulatory protein
VLEENTSSQNDKYTVQSLTQHSINAPVTNVELDDGSTFVVFTGYVDEAGLEVGAQLSEEEVRELEQQAQFVVAYDKALELLARAEHSDGKMRQKLFKRGFSTTVTEKVILTLKKKGYIDNKRYAEQWIHTRIRRYPEGRAALVAGLLRRGVDRDTAEHVVRREVTEEVVQNNLQRAFQMCEAKFGDDRIKLYRALLRRGFRSGDIKTVLGQEFEI